MVRTASLGGDELPGPNWSFIRLSQAPRLGKVVIDQTWHEKKREGERRREEGKRRGGERPD